MGADEKKKVRGGRVLRFAVSGALLVAPATIGCGGAEEAHANEPMTHTNEPAPDPHTNEPSMEEGDTVNEPAPMPEEEEPIHTNEVPSPSGE